MQNKPASADDYPYVFRWRNNPTHANKYGRLCKVVQRDRMNFALLRFEDGSQLLVRGPAVCKANTEYGRRIIEKGNELRVQEGEAAREFING